MIRQLCTLLPLLTLSCAASVELAEDRRVEPSEDPTVLGVINERVQQIAVDGQRIYWIGSITDAASGWRSDATLRSCRKQDCSNSLISYDDAAHGSSEFSVQNGQIYWLHLTDAGGTAQKWSLVSCSVEGCTRGLHTVAKELYGAFGGTFSTEAMFVFVNEVRLDTVPQLLKIPLAGSVSTPEVLLSDAQWSHSTVARGQYLYWIEPSRNDYGATALVRMLVRGGSPVEVLAEGLGFHSIAVDSSYVYWSRDGLNGAILRCPVAGCEGGPEVFVSPVRQPGNLTLENGNLYWQHDTLSQGGAVSRCSLVNCVLPARVAEGVAPAQDLAFDDQYLYTVTIDEIPNPDEVWLRSLVKIRRLPK